jgi:hypothetical protein
MTAPLAKLDKIKIFDLNSCGVTKWRKMNKDTFSNRASVASHSRRGG